MKRSTSPYTILLVDDEDQILFSSSLMLKGSGFDKVITVNDAARVMPTLEAEDISLVVLDLCMPGSSGEDLLKQISYRFPQIPVVVMTAVSELETAVACMKSGAFDYLTKPVQTDTFLACVRRALEMFTLKQENCLLKERLLSGDLIHKDAFTEILTVNRQMRGIFQYMEAVAASAQPLLITGETGTGKELVSRAIHAMSGRKGALVADNVAGLDDTVFSDTIFGHKKGAFTGADSDREGLISRAAAGTLFLDEIGDLEAKSQVKLLRLLQEREYYPLGSDITKKTDARIIVATNRDLHRMTAEGTFRNDLYYRLCPHHIAIPPLRDRLDDLPLLIDHFLEEAALDLGKKKPTHPPELITLLATYHFPGNIRELKGMIQDAVTRHKGGVLSLESFNDYLGKLRTAPLAATAPTGTETFLCSFPERLPTFHEAEDLLVAEALKRSCRNQGMAAKMLGITRQALNKRLQKSNSLLAT